MATVPPPTLTAEEFLALPDDGMDRELIRGQVKERPMSYRNRLHARVSAKITRYLDVWLDDQPAPRGQILVGDAGFRLPGREDSIVGIDVAYASAATLDASRGRTTIVDGPPVLAVEILSPTNTQEEVDDKIDLHLETGVSVVWVVRPRARTIEVRRPGAPSETVNETGILMAEPELPGFRVPVAALFKE